MTPTDELRRLLDKRGVEYEAPHAGFTIVRTDNAVCKFYETLEEPERGVFAVVTTDWLTPEQAVEAALGRGTCHMRLAYEEEDADGFIWPDHYECDACGANVNGIMASCDTEIQPRYCPNCGRKVVVE